MKQNPDMIEQEDAWSCGSLFSVAWKAAPVALPQWNGMNGTELQLKFFMKPNPTIGHPIYYPTTMICVKFVCMWVYHYVCVYVCVCVCVCVYLLYVCHCVHMCMCVFVCYYILFIDKSAIG